MGPIGLQELVIIVAVAVAVFGTRHLPKFGRVAGNAARELRGIQKTVEDTKEELDAELKKSIEL